MDNTKSMLDVAYTIMSKAKKEMTFADLYEQIVKELAMNDDEKKSHLGEFYTELTLDGRFVALTDNGWDLRTRHTYDKVHIDVNDVYSDVEEGDEDEEDEEEEKEFEAQIEGKPVADHAAPEPESEDADVEKPAVDEDVASLVGKKSGGEY
ncbi:MAG: DNA-directed RNA polymerase subunit delta [Bacilli bacterium]